jgi:hypothetical protein
MREQFIKASRALEALPGVLSRHVSAVYSGPQYLDQYLRSDLAQNIG